MAALGLAQGTDLLHNTGCAVTSLSGDGQHLLGTLKKSLSHC